MKTFEEAVATVLKFQYVETDQQEADFMKQSRADLEVTRARYAGIEADVRKSPLYEAMYFQWVILGRRDALLSAFMSGLIVGMEWRKSRYA